VSVLAAAATVLATADPAAAYPGKPLTMWSFYVLSNNTGKAYTLGCNQGDFDEANHLSSSEVVIDFGVQRSNLSGNVLTGTGAFMSRADIKNYAYQFALGYYVCTGAWTSSTLFLDLGTNNDNSTTTATMGTDWANAVQETRNSLSANNVGQVVVQGANDLEPGFHASYSQSAAWASAYSAANHGLYLNFGSADGCPQTTHTNGGCNNGWNQNGLWNVSWHVPAAICAPEIYFTANAKQWEQIALYGSTQGSTSRYIGVWDEYDLDTGTLTPQGAWDALLSQLYSNAETAIAPTYSMEIHNA
jgi:hypothetical protein